MSLENFKIKVFFFGSPGDGFSAFPADYSNLVSAYDRAEREHKLECIYTITPKNSIIRYVEYGLTGKGEHGSVRGGRNFGLWLEMEGVMVDKKGQKKILEYIIDFISNGIIKNGNILEPSGETKNYKIFSFNDASETLQKLREALMANFKNDFQPFFIPIKEQNSSKVDLIPPPPPKKKPEKSEIRSGLNPPMPNPNEITEKRSESIQMPRGNSIRKPILFFLVILVIWMLYLTYSSYQVNKTLDKILQELISSNHKSANTSGVTIQDAEELPIGSAMSQTGETESKKEKPLEHVLNDGETLKQVIISYNETYGTHHRTEDIQCYNNIDDPRKLKAGQVIKFPDKETKCE